MTPTEASAAEHPSLDLDEVRRHFPAFDAAINNGESFFENAGGSWPCRQTIDALHDYYTNTKVQPYAAYGSSAHAGESMDRSTQRWAEALGVGVDEVSFGPSTSTNTYVLATAFGELLGAGDEVIVTNQDHEANTGAIRRSAAAAGATVREWRTDPATGLLDPAGLESLLSDATRLVTFPHCSNIVGQENDVQALCAMAHDAGARVIVDAVSYAPHSFADVAALDPDVYLFSLYKTYSVHQGLMVHRRGIVDELPNQGHGFNSHLPNKRLTPSGPDHAQIAAADAVLDYVEVLDQHHFPTAARGDLRASCDRVSALWRAHEDSLVRPVLDMLAAHPGARLLGPGADDAPGHRCPTVAFVPRGASPADVAHRLVAEGIQCSAGTFYADRVLDGLDVSLDTGVVRVSWVHYTGPDEIESLLRALDVALSES